MFRNALDRIFEKRAIPKLETYMMKKINGSECTCDQQGQITELKDAEGRAWRFAYHHRQLTQFRDPNGNSWVLSEGKWQPERDLPGCPTPKEVAINHATGEIRVEDNIRLTVYLPDGTTQIEVIQVMDGKPTRVRFTEYPSHPHRSFIVSERHGNLEYVTWVQDANAKLFKLEYERGKLVRYTDMSAKPSAIIWTATYDAAGVIRSWTGQCKATGKDMGEMQPVLQSVEPNGNRNFRSASGTLIVVEPNGTAFARRISEAANNSFSKPFPVPNIIT